MKKGMAVVSVILLCSGCASWMDYRDLQSRHDHLLDEKERLETEQTDLRGIVAETRRSYQVASHSLGTLQAQIEQNIQTTRAAREELAKTKAMADSHTQELRAQGQRVDQLGTQFSQLMGQVGTMTDRSQALTERVDQLLTVTKRLSARIPDQASTKSAVAKGGGKEKPDTSRSAQTAKIGTESVAAAPVAAVPAGKSDKGQVAGSQPVESHVEPTQARASVTPTAVPAPVATSSVPTPTATPAVSPTPSANPAGPTIVDMTKFSQAAPPEPAQAAPAADVKPQITRADISPVPVSRLAQLKAWASGLLPGSSKPTTSAESASMKPLSSGTADEKSAPASTPSQKLLTISEHPGVPAPGEVVTVPVVPVPAK